MSKKIAIPYILFAFMLGGCFMNNNSEVMTIKNPDHIQEGYIPVTGGKIWYKIIGKNKKGIPVIVVHGGPGASHDYLEPLAELADERPVVFYDQLGCGNSDKPDDVSLWRIERFVNELHQVREALGLKNTHIIGQSWGTSLAIDYLLTKPAAGTISLVLSGPLLSSSRWIEDGKAYIDKLPNKIQNVILKCEESGNFSSPKYQDAMMAYYKLHVCRLNPWPQCLNRSFEKLNFVIYDHMWGPSEFTVTGELKTYERVDRLKEITIPVLFTCGVYDEATPETTRYYQENLPNSELYIFENASHEHHLEKPQEYLQTVRNFLRRAERINK